MILCFSVLSCLQNFFLTKRYGQNATALKSFFSWNITKKCLFQLFIVTYESILVCITRLSCWILSIVVWSPQKNELFHIHKCRIITLCSYWCFYDDQTAFVNNTLSIMVPPINSTKNILMYFFPFNALVW